MSITFEQDLDRQISKQTLVRTVWVRKQIIVIHLQFNANLVHTNLNINNLQSKICFLVRQTAHQS